MAEVVPVRKRIVLALGFIGAVIVAGSVRIHLTANTARLQRLVSPGNLSPAHAFLEGRCSACHTPGKSVEAVNCIVCHANNPNLLQRQPTAFHANIDRCAECHAEHRGGSVRPVAMDHAALARISLAAISRKASGSEGRVVAKRVQDWIRSTPRVETGAAPLEAALDCATCHATKDRHVGIFGNECSQCHVTTQWKVAGFQHPSERSFDCAQCHQAPPSHYMEHFTMISKRIASQPEAQVNQCYLCHQTTAWNDIRGIGWYKHH